MKILLSIKPEFIDKIFSGEKKYEYRRSIFKKQPIKTIVIYASSPIQKVVGEFEIGEVLIDDIDSLWRRTHKHSGITEDFYYRYFADKDHGYAIEIVKARKYRIALCLRKHFNLLPPQSYVYL